MATKTRSSKDWQFEINRLKTIKQHQSNDLDNYPRESKDYKDGLALVKTTQKQIANAQNQFTATKKQEETSKQLATQKKQTTANQQDLSTLSDERQRLIDQGLPTTDIDAQMSAILAKNPVSSTGSTSKPSKGQTTKTFIDGLLKDSATTAPKPVVPPKTTGKGTGTTGGTGIGGTGGKNTPPAPVLSQQDFLTKYGTTLAFIQSDPSLKKLFDDASKGGWNTAKFQAQLQQTDWAHKFSAQAQQQELARTQSPSTFGSSWNNMRNLIATTAVSLGLNIRPQDVGNELKPTGTGGVWQSKDVPRQDGTITQWALEHANDTNFQEELQQHLTTVGNINLNMPGGTAGTDIQALKKYAASMGLLGYQLPSATDPNNPNSKGMDYFSSAAQSILLGKSDMQTWQGDMLAQAKQRYKSFASSLDAGQTVQNLAAPYINTLANLLEISPDKVDLSSPTGYGKMVNDALMGTDATNQTPMTLTDFEKQIKARPEWGYTNNARDTLMPGVDSLLKTLGKVS